MLRQITGLHGYQKGVRRVLSCRERVRAWRCCGTQRPSPGRPTSESPAATQLLRAADHQHAISSAAAAIVPKEPHSSSSFDLSQAVALAAAAFEAYLEPRGTGAYKDRDGNATETTFTDREFLLNQYQGLLLLTVHGATGLPAANLVGDASDPCVVASLADTCQVTPVVRGDTNPVWEVTLPLYVRDVASGVLQLHVANKSNLQRSTDLGCVSVPVAQLITSKAEELSSIPEVLDCAHCLDCEDGSIVAGSIMGRAHNSYDNQELQLQHQQLELGQRQQQQAFIREQKHKVSHPQRLVLIDEQQQQQQQQQLSTLQQQPAAMHLLQQEDQVQQNRSQEQLQAQQHQPEVQQEEQSSHSRPRLTLPLTGECGGVEQGTLTVSAQWLPFSPQEPSVLDRLLAPGKDFPTPPQELVAVGSAVAAVAALPAEAAQQLQQVATQVQQTAEQLRQQAAGVAEAAQPVLGTASQVVEELSATLQQAAQVLTKQVASQAEAAVGAEADGGPGAATSSSGGRGSTTTTTRSSSTSCSTTLCMSVDAVSAEDVLPQDVCVSASGSGFAAGSGSGSPASGFVTPTTSTPSSTTRPGDSSSGQGGGVHGTGTAASTTQPGSSNNNHGGGVNGTGTATSTTQPGSSSNHGGVVNGTDTAASTTQPGSSSNHDGGVSALAAEGGDSTVSSSALTGGVDGNGTVSSQLLSTLSSTCSSISESYEEVVLEEVVGAFKQQVLEALDSSMSGAAQQLQSAGLDNQAAAVHSIKDAAVAQVTAAADGVTSYVTRKGLGKLPVSSLNKLVTAIQQLHQEEAAAREAEQRAAAAQAASFACRGPLDTITSTGGLDELLAQAGAADQSARTPTLVPQLLPCAWRALAEAVGKVVDDIYAPVAYLDNPKTDTQAWVHVSRELREVVVAFRGTEFVKWKDLLSDINFFPTSLEGHWAQEGESSMGPGQQVELVPLPFATFKKNKQVMVHSGFLSAYDSIRGRVLSLVAALTAEATPSEPWGVWVTGHSLGGALATLAAYELAGRSMAQSGAHKVAMYTYGAPRVGNQAFADAFNERLQGATWRITNSNDIVPSVPRLMGYAHVKTGVRLTGGGGMLFEEGSHDVLGEGREVLEVLGDMAVKAVQVAQGAVELETLLDHEMQLLSALADGSALEHHMEDLYLLSLKDCVLAAAPELRGKVEEAVAAAVAASAGYDKTDSS